MGCGGSTPADSATAAAMPYMPGKRAQIIEIADDFTPKDKAEGTSQLEACNKRAEEIAALLDGVELDEASEHFEDEDEKEEEEDDETPEEKVDKHKAIWEKRKKKYQKYADHGKVEKLQRALARQQGKLQKAKDKGCAQTYIDYKQYKVDFTKQLISVAILIRNLKAAGLMG
uniref:Uncharacterized protein n=1 Tax=Haptolina brevifila TaxID=156173 RepID=A0A7S2HDB1_9EUKA|mmetsp:Transcript_53493/g.106451  ORF Transcript_53493/g.106451 Transcript_53493/m.106451 type:complete len:172 (+) Transcript_53493:121-636(+)|eukprot:CAMPEP_0174714540 /NCGR_PEP_ID=MMETSP1094-20130205/18525_1 /TAXON_ID=156173 /ORGANISM="Chrysochromulina brevifilum, Strain UTEX LB 985" /LENGTH=171 /DNA_ID=CAMNT_0015913923 /DNA_START=97 /DNA_END=612 /DNA_ORIENTATION=+